jgi:hypothetical protein
VVLDFDPKETWEAIFSKYSARALKVGQPNAEIAKVTQK